jgi:hypothetical protein
MRIFYLIMLRVYARKVTLGSQDAEARVPWLGVHGSVTLLRKPH